MTRSTRKSSSPPRVNPVAILRRWWRKQTPVRQDRLAVLAPIFAVVFFLFTVGSAIWYLRSEEMDRERDAVKRDVEYAQQRLRLRLLERQEQFMRFASDIADRDVDTENFIDRAETLINQYPELQIITWVDGQHRIKVSYASPSLANLTLRKVGELLKTEDTASSSNLARETQQPVYSQPVQPISSMKSSAASAPMLQMHIPVANPSRVGLVRDAKANGTGDVILAEYAVEGLLRFAVPPEVQIKYAVALLDSNNRLLAGSSVVNREHVSESLLRWLPLMRSNSDDYEVPVPPVGNGLVLRAQTYRTSYGLIGSGLFWLVTILSAMTAWLLIGTWRHTRHRTQAQQALVVETNFRRAMENSMLTGMRALDMQGRITYVNAAFCQMTGWSESELVGQSPPFPYWAQSDQETLQSRLDEELTGNANPAGFQIRLKRRDGSPFDARMYVSPLVNAHGDQTGWMTSVTDITEPNRVREQLAASYERFTTVLEALDASVSVAPLGSDELLYANKLHRQWFNIPALATDTQSSGAQPVDGTRPQFVPNAVRAIGHLQMLAAAGVPGSALTGNAQEDEDGLAGLPTGTLTATKTENDKIYIPALHRWLEIRTRYLNWVDGRLAQMVIATDITSRHLAEEQADVQAERAQSASRLITMGEMASSVAHELNQPLTAISNYCNGMASRIRSGNIVKQDLLGALDKTSRQAQRAGQIIQRIRSFVKRSAPNRTVSNIATMVNEAIELVEIELRRRRVQLSYHLAERLPDILVDPILIEQVLINLLKNAAESIDQAQRPPLQRNIELKVIPQRMNDHDVIEFVVTDTGGGLAPEVLAHLFEAFFSTKSDGMGIGLNLCRSIVESHQGRMQAQNLYNGSLVEGCRFSFWLPLNPLSTADLDGVDNSTSNLLHSTGVSA